jgi:hypothetical protein
MKRQASTHASLAPSATDSHVKGLQQYFTPPVWARALGAALPGHRRTIADLHCGDGSFLAGLANDTTKDLLGLDLDPQGRIQKVVMPGPYPQEPRRHFAHGDVLDLFPLLIDARAGFDLLALNPPFSLHWPLAILPEPLRKGLTGSSIDSTHATLRMIPPLLSDRGEAILIANQFTLVRLHLDHPEDFDKAWFWIDLPSFFPGVSSSLMVGVLFLAAGHEGGPARRSSYGAATTPDSLAASLDQARASLFAAPCVEDPWNAETETFRKWDASTAEMERRRDPSASNANIVLSDDGRLRTWVTAWQEASVTVPPHLKSFLHRVNRHHPLQLTIQRATRVALQEAIDSGFWTISDDARAALNSALAEFECDRAPLAPVTLVQRVGWLDDAEELRCSSDFGPFRAGCKYPIETQTIEWKKQEYRPRYQAGRRTEEAIMVKGTDLQISLVLPDGGKVHFIWNPARVGGEHHSLEDLANHFHLPEVPDISTLRVEEFSANVALLDELELLTS